MYDERIFEDFEHVRVSNHWVYCGECVCIMGYYDPNSRFTRRDIRMVVGSNAEEQEKFENVFIHKASI